MSVATEVKDRVMMIDDRPGDLKMVRRYLEQHFDVVVHSDPSQAQEQIVLNPPDIILLDIQFGPNRDLGLELLGWIRQVNERIPILMLSKLDRIPVIVKAIQEGAKDYIPKNEDPNLIVLKVEKELAAKREETLHIYNEQRLHTAETETHRLIFGTGPASRKLMESIENAARSDFKVLLQGESGSGKTAVARLIHERSRRTDGPFIKVAVPTLTPTLVKSELFGHKKGAFEGAYCDKIGAFEAAHRGTCFLDDFQSMDPDIQAAVLNVLEDGSFRPVGPIDSPEKRTDFRFIAATNVDLREMRDDGTFRNDLLNRVYSQIIRVPSLKDRKEDIPALVELFLAKHQERSGRDSMEISEVAMQFLMDEEWINSNVRGLENRIIHAMGTARHDRIGLEDVRDPLESKEQDEGLPLYAVAQNRAHLRTKWGYFIELIRQAEGDLKRASGISGQPENSIRNILKELDLNYRDGLRPDVE